MSHNPRFALDSSIRNVSVSHRGKTTTASYTLDDNLIVYGDNTYRYDDDGYLVEKTTPQGSATYTYSTLGALTDITLPDGTQIRYYQDALSRRVAKEVNGTVVEKYLWEDLTTLLAVYDGNDRLVWRFEYADQRMPISMTSNGQKYYLHYDQVGSLRSVSRVLSPDNTTELIKEITYDTYGNILTDSSPSFTIPFGFAGGLYDADTKLTRFGYRDYDAYTGKWTAKDPIGFSGGDSNLYGYVLGDPVNLVDPDGRNPLLLLLFFGVGLSEYGNSPTVGETPLSGPTGASIVLPLAPLAKPVQELCVVTRWASPASTTLKTDDWVMLGGKNLKNWALSGKMTPLNPKYHVPYNLGRTFTVPTKSLRYPKGWEKFKGLPPWNQRQYR